MCIGFRQIFSRFQLRSCTIVSNGLEARSTKSGFLVEWASSPFLKSLLTLLQDVSLNKPALTQRAIESIGHDTIVNLRY
jgi:hypothetical protein